MFTLFVVQPVVAIPAHARITHHLNKRPPAQGAAYPKVYILGDRI